MSSVHTVLVVEGRKPDSKALLPFIAGQGYNAVSASTRRDALALVERASPDVILLDSPSLRFSVRRFCRTLRDKGRDIPILLLLAEGEEVDHEIGARIYLHYPFSTKKLLNRLARLLPGADGDVLKVGGLVLDLKQRCVVNGEHEGHLTPRQARLLEVLMRHSGEVLPRSYLMRQVWDTDYVGDTRTLEVHIHWVRKALGNPSSSAARLRTVRGVGYCLEVAEEGEGNVKK